MRKQSARVIHTRLDAKRESAAMSPLYAGIVALRLGRADTEHYHDLAGAMSIAYRTAEKVERHRPLLAEIQPALDALTAIFNRAEQRTVKDAPWSGTPDEIDLIENGVNIYRAILRTTPGKVILGAIRRIQQEAHNIA